MSKDDWPNFRVSDEYDHKLAYHAAKGQHMLPSCSTYRPWRITASKDGCEEGHTYKTKREALMACEKYVSNGYGVTLEKYVLGRYLLQRT